MPVVVLNLRALSTDPSSLCWHCCHPCEIPPVHLPVTHDDRRDEFVCMGAFCSWACAKAYARDYMSSHRWGPIGMNIQMFRRRTESGYRSRPLVSAPPRPMLKAFGGHLSVEEFRKRSAAEVRYAVLPVRMRPLYMMLEERRRTGDEIPDHKMTDAVDLTNASARNEQLRLRFPAEDLPPPPDPLYPHPHPHPHAPPSFVLPVAAAPPDPPAPDIAALLGISGIK